MASLHLPETIKTVIQPDPKSSSLKLTRTPLPVPAPDAKDAFLIQVKATAPCLNELTWEVGFPHLFPPDRERVPCTECAGIVVRTPAAPDRFRTGDEVYFRRNAWDRGCLSEYTLARPDEMALKPRSLSWAEAAATPLSALTAYQGLFEHGLLDRDALADNGAAARARNARVRVLITGAGGGVGGWAVQLAAAAGAGAVVAVCGPSKADAVRCLGAGDVVDYTAQPLAAWAGQDPARACDMVLDCVGGDTLAGCWSAVGDGGVLLSVTASPESVRPPSATGKPAKSAWFLVEPRGSDLERISSVDAGLARPLVDSVVDFEHFEDAFQRVQEGHPKGKVVIRVAD